MFTDQKHKTDDFSGYLDYKLIELNKNFEHADLEPVDKIIDVIDNTIESSVGSGNIFQKVSKFIIHMIFVLFTCFYHISYWLFGCFTRRRLVRLVFSLITSVLAYVFLTVLVYFIYKCVYTGLHYVDPGLNITTAAVNNISKETSKYVRMVYDNSGGRKYKVVEDDGPVDAEWGAPDSNNG